MKIRTATIGTNFIVDSFVKGARMDARFDYAAVYSRKQETATAFAAKYGIEGLNDADGMAMLKADDISVELLEDQQTRSVLACAEIGFPPPDADGAFGAMSWATVFRQV